MRHPGVSQRSCGPRPLGTSCHSPSKLGEKSKEASRTSPPLERQRYGARTMTSQRTSPPWSGSGTGEYRRRRGGGASEASQETPWSSPAVLRTAPPRHFVPLPQQAGGEIQRGQSDVSPVERQRQGGTDDDPPKDFSPVERQRNGGVRPEAGRGRERSEPEDHSVSPAAGTDRAPLHSADRYIGEEAKPRTSPPAGGRGKVPPAERSEAEAERSEAEG